MLTASPIRMPISRSVRTMATTVSREGDELVAPLAPHLLDQRRAGQLDPRDQQDRRQAGQRDQVQPRGQEHDADQQQDAVDDRRELRPAAGVDVHRAADDHRRDRQPADQPGDHVPDPLGQQFPARGRGPLPRVELVDRLQVQQRLQRGHGGDASAAAVYTAGFDHCEKSGDCRNPKNPARLSATGTCTRWLGSIDPPARRAAGTPG